MSIQMVDPQGTILREIDDKRLKRDDIASTYAWCLRAKFTDDDAIDWVAINLAIVDRWSRAGLEYIKTKAWGIYEGKTDA